MTKKVALPALLVVPALRGAAARIIMMIDPIRAAVEAKVTMTTGPKQIAAVNGMKMAVL